MAVSVRFTKLAILFAITAVVLTSSCGGKAAKNNVSDSDATLNDTTFTDTTFTDSRDGQVYKTVKIGEQVWMAQNLNYAADGSKCFGEGGKFTQWYYEGESEEETLSEEQIREICAGSGRLYDWETAKTAVPRGWHLPSKEEWETLLEFAGGRRVAGKGLLKEKGFSGSTPGWGYGDGFGQGAVNADYWWSATECEYESSATEIDKTNAYAFNIGYTYVDEDDNELEHDGGAIDVNGSSDIDSKDKNYLYSVRCVKDAPPAEKKTASEKPSKKKKEYGVSFNYTDADELKEYKTVTIGAQTWMAENLNYAAEGSKCYKDEDGNCAKYGRLYNWATAKTACPAGWHLPTDEEWTALINHIGGEETAGKYLKSASGWNDNGNGGDDYGFSALPGGSGFYLSGGGFGGFGKIGEMSFFWSATAAEKGGYWYRAMRGENEKITKYYSAQSLFSVRCVAD
jgi:uncharacterized protein (TIGR02145 family)